MHRFTNRHLVIATLAAAIASSPGRPGRTRSSSGSSTPTGRCRGPPDGQPDLQGMWGNKTLTPIERPANLEGRAFLTDEEIAASATSNAHRRRARRATRRRRSATRRASNVGGYGSYWLDAGDTVLSTGQTSLIVDPPDGRARDPPVGPRRTRQYNLAHNGDDYIGT